MLWLYIVQKSDGHYNMPNASIVLQGAKAELIDKNQNPSDIVLVSIFTYTNYTQLCIRLSYKQTSLLQYSVAYGGREMSIGQSAVMLCSWRVKAGWLIPYADKRMSGR